MASHAVMGPLSMVFSNPLLSMPLLPALASADVAMAQLRLLQRPVAECKKQPRPAVAFKAQRPLAAECKKQPRPAVAFKAQRPLVAECKKQPRPAVAFKAQQPLVAECKKQPRPAVAFKAQRPLVAEYRSNRLRQMSDYESLDRL
jgi:hypothetical protein